MLREIRAFVFHHGSQLLHAHVAASRLQETWLLELLGKLVLLYQHLNIVLVVMELSQSAVEFSMPNGKCSFRVMIHSQESL